jgi:tRNA nucleotidyltransferase (CCA-adding enzyme)
VFLVEISGEKCEIALARTERKISIGHKGFEFNTSSLITIEQDLQRRDFTMNSIAQEVLTQKIIDPFYGINDIKHRLIRANNGAFSEDPLRVFRAARFAATLDFCIFNDTSDLMHLAAENLNELTPERVFKETEKALHSKPSRFFEALEESECLGWFPEINALCRVQAGPASSKHGTEDTFAHTMNAIDHEALQTPLERFAVLCHDFGKALSPEPPKHHGHEKEGLSPVKELCDRLKVPNKYKKAALCFTENHMRMHKIKETRSGKAARLITKIQKAMPGGLESFLRCSQADGMSQAEAKEILLRGERVLDVRIPTEYYNRGKKCAEILLNLQGKEWKRSRSRRCKRILLYKNKNGS